MKPESLPGWNDFGHFPWYAKAVWTPDQLSERVKLLRSRGLIIAMTCGNFDPIHIGHIDGFGYGCELIGASEGVPLNRVMLVVGVDCDDTVKDQKGSDRPVQPLLHRIMFLAAIECVECVVPFSGGRSEPLLDIVEPDGFFKGADRTWIRTPERMWLNRTGTQFYRVPRRLPISSSQMMVYLGNGAGGLELENKP